MSNVAGAEMVAHCSAATNVIRPFVNLVSNATLEGQHSRTLSMHRKELSGCAFVATLSLCQSLSKPVLES